MNHDKTQLGLATLVMLVVAAMIGFGVFTSSGFALAALGNPDRVLVAWVLCGVWAVAGAVAYGALAKRLPLSGGEYLFLSRLMAPSIGFLAGWISLVAGFTAPIAAAAKAVIAYGFPAITSDAAANGLATVVIVAACLCHAARMSIGALAQNAIVLIKLGFIVWLLVWAFAFTSSSAWQGGSLPGRDTAALPSDASGWIDLLAAMSWIALSYTGFNAAVYVAGESQAAQRNVPRAMLWATLLVTAIYILLNIIFLKAPPPEQIVGDPSRMAAIAATATRALGGPAMETLTRAIIALAVLSSVFSMLLAGPRVYLQMARDGVMPKFLKPAGDVPTAAVLMQAALSIAVVWLAQLEQIIGYLGMTLSACSGLAVAAIWRLHRSAETRAATEQQPVTWLEHSAAGGYIVGTLVMLAAVLASGQRTAELVAVAFTFVTGLLVHIVWKWRYA
ncbi:MAG: APC family permease [Aureliella sp.]